MTSMFQDASSFNQSLRPWSTSNVLSADNIFCGCPVLATPSYYPTFNFTPVWGCPSIPMIINAYIPSVVDFSTVILPFSSIVSLDVDFMSF
jgi:hypothetical protein